MIDYTELKKLAEAALGDTCTFTSINAFKSKIDAATVLKMLAHIEQQEQHIIERDQIIVELNKALDEAYP